LHKFSSPNLEQTQTFAKEVITPLLREHRFLVLAGDLGSGKTTLTRYISQALEASELATSPTYALMHRHDLPSQKVLFHWDLYRLGSALEADGVGFFDEIQNPNSLHIIEWADRIRHHLPHKYLYIECHAGLDEHVFEYEVYERPIPTEEKIQALREKYETPENVIGHCEVCGQVARQICEAYGLDPLFTVTACRLHDLLRALDFMPGDERREKLIAEFGEIQHEIAAGNLLTSLGYPELGRAIDTHRTSSLYRPEVHPLTLEEKIVYYADKRVKHTEIVSVAERFRDGRERNAHLMRPEEHDLEERTLRIERELFSKINLNPEDIK